MTIGNSNSLQSGLAATLTMPWIVSSKTDRASFPRSLFSSATARSAFCPSAEGCGSMRFGVGGSRRGLRLRRYRAIEHVLCRLPDGDDLVARLSTVRCRRKDEHDAEPYWWSGALGGFVLDDFDLLIHQPALRSATSSEISIRQVVEPTQAGSSFGGGAGSFGQHQQDVVGLCPSRRWPVGDTDRGGSAITTPAGRRWSPLSTMPFTWLRAVGMPVRCSNSNRPAWAERGSRARVRCRLGSAASRAW